MNFDNKNAIKRVTPCKFLCQIIFCNVEFAQNCRKFEFSGEKIEFHGKKSSFAIFGQNEFPSKRTKKAWLGLPNSRLIFLVVIGSYYELMFCCSLLDYSPQAKTHYGHVQSLSQLAQDLVDKIKTFSEVMDAVGTLLQVQSLYSLLNPSEAL